MESVSKPTNRGIHLLIAEDSILFRDALEHLLIDEPSIAEIRTASNGVELLEMLKESVPNVILMDIEMPEMNGIQVTGIIKENHPEVKILGLSMHSDAQSVVPMLLAGANGYLDKNTNDRCKLVSAIHGVMSGMYIFDGKAVESVMQNLGRVGKMQRKAIEVNGVRVSGRELEVLKLIANGHSGPAIAEKMFISQNTVITHRKHLLQKLGCKNSAELTRYAMINELV